MLTKYRLQEKFKPLGERSTDQLAMSSVVIIGCGATGSHTADTLARMGVGKIVVIDPDVVVRGNLHRQLYNESAVGAPKAIILANHLRAINSDVTVLAIGDKVINSNIERHVGKPDLILDCTDNMDIRWLINEYSVKHNIPWIYCGVGRSKGMVMAIIPGQTACLRCTGWAPTESEDRPRGGIFPPAVAIMANFQATIAIKILTDNVDGHALTLRQFDVWSMESMSFNVQRNEECPVCGKEYVKGEKVQVVKDTSKDEKDWEWIPATVLEPKTKSSVTLALFSWSGVERSGHRLDNEIRRIRTTQFSLDI